MVRRLDAIERREPIFDIVGRVTLLRQPGAKAATQARLVVDDQDMLLR